VGKKDARGAKARNQTAQGRVNGIVFDAGGLIALERNDRRVFSILDTALEDGDRIIVPATALAQVIRNPARQVICAQTAGYAIITSDPLDLKRLDSSLRLIRI